MKYNLDLVANWSSNEKKKPVTSTTSESEWWLPKDGENIIRIIPGETTWILRGYKHFNVGPSKKHTWCRKSDPSGNKNWNEPCPVCEFVNALYKTGDPNDKTLADRMRAKERVLLNIVDLSEPDKGVRLFECPATLWKIMDKYWKSKKYGNLANPDNGYNFVVAKKGAKGQQNYDDSYAVDDSTPIQNKEWLAQTKDLWEKVAPYIKSYDGLKSVLETGEDTDYEDNKNESKSETTPSIEKVVSKASVLPKDEIPNFEAAPRVEVRKEVKVEEVPKTKKTSKPSCFGIKYMDDTDLCEACKYIELCEAEFGEKLESDTDPEVDEILKSMK